MLFARRHKPTLSERIRVAMLPRRSYVRSARYIGYRVMRLGGNPHGLALGLAVGVFIATLPIIGAQFLTAALLAWLVRGNVAAALLGTFWANPITSPFIWLASYGLGNLVLPSQAALTTAELSQRLWQVRTALFSAGNEPLAATYSLIWPIFKPTFLGAVPIGVVTAVVFYYGCLHLITVYRAGRNNGLATVETGRIGISSIGRYS